MCCNKVEKFKITQFVCVFRIQTNLLFFFCLLSKIVDDEKVIDFVIR